MRRPTATGDRRSKPAKRLPDGAGQHATAGPYSPVLEVDARHLVVISGQAALNARGEVIGDGIEQQARITLENCERQLATAGCTLADVFKTNVYLRDLDDWPRFNRVYERMLPRPLPVRTTIQSVLLPGFLVEIEMWAARPGE